MMLLFVYVVCSLEWVLFDEFYTPLSKPNAPFFLGNARGHGNAVSETKIFTCRNYVSIAIAMCINRKKK